MGTADGDGRLILPHHLTKELCPCKGGDPFFLHGKKFRVVRMNGAGVDNQIDIIRYVIPALTVADTGTFFGEHFRERGTLVVGTGNLKTLRQQDFRQAAHADSADADKVNMYWFVKMNLIHYRYLFLILGQALARIA